MRPAALRQTIVAHLGAALGSAWREGGQVYDAFPGDESRQVQHLAFAVGLPEDMPTPRPQSRSVVTTTVVGVRFSAHIRAGSSTADYDRALEAEADLMVAIASIKDETPLPLRITGGPTRIVEGTVFLGEVICEVAHAYPLVAPE